MSHVLHFRQHDDLCPEEGGGWRLLSAAVHLQQQEGDAPRKQGPRGRLQDIPGEGHLQDLKNRWKSSKNIYVHPRIKYTLQRTACQWRPGTRWGLWPWTTCSRGRRTPRGPPWPPPTRTPGEGELWGLHCDNDDNNKYLSQKSRGVVFASKYFYHQPHSSYDQVSTKIFLYFSCRYRISTLMKNIRSINTQNINLLCLPHLNAIVFPTSTILWEYLTFYSFSSQITLVPAYTGCRQSSGPLLIRRGDTRNSVHPLYLKKGLNFRDGFFLFTCHGKDQPTWCVVKHSAWFLVIRPVVPLGTLVATIQQWKLYHNCQNCTNHGYFMNY